MAKSMTGYGSEVIHIDKTMITVEIRSVNHRFLDLHTKVPSSYLFLEENIKNIIKSYFDRGHIEIFISIDGEGLVKKSLQMDWDLLDQYMKQLQEAKSRYHLSGEIPVSVITQIPEIITVQQIKEQSEQQTEEILAGIESACKKVLKMRETEGKNLIYDIINRMEQVHETVTLFTSQREMVVNEYRERIQKRINEYLDKRMDADDSRIHQEIALLAEKGDIAEEITRLLSHIDHFFATMEKNEPIGRQLDFILQEMHREINTIGSKSTDPKISEWVVTIKSEIEKMKEQIQNIE